MANPNEQAEWYYVGHFGQLGPLTLTQMQELALDGVVTAETFVWRTGMGDWAPAANVTDLKSMVGVQEPVGGPPAFSPATQFGAPPSPYPRTQIAQPSDWRYIQTHAPKSDKTRVLGGILNIVFPGAGRFYLGYGALGVLQFFISVVTCGVGTVWPFIDGIYILAGGVKLDGYGRRLDE